jgi:hypothetical protein
MTGQPDRRRVSCPRCRANNFVGQAQCWQCHASLPPPEAMQAPPPSAYPQAGFASAPIARQSDSRSGLYGVIGVLVVCLIGLGIFILRPKPTETASRDWRQSEQAMIKEAENFDSDQPRLSLPSDPMLDAQTRGQTAGDATVSEAQRVLERERANLGVAPTSGGSGDIRLRSGGSISREQWDDVSRRVRNNPYMKEPPMPPPL